MGIFHFIPPTHTSNNNDCLLTLTFTFTVVQSPAILNSYYDYLVQSCGYALWPRARGVVVVFPRDEAECAGLPIFSETGSAVAVSLKA
jgi:hypothetical protein